MGGSLHFYFKGRDLQNVNEPIKSSKSSLIKLKEIFIYYKDYLFDSKKNDINIIENIINNN